MTKDKNGVACQLLWYSLGMSPSGSARPCGRSTGSPGATKKGRLPNLSKLTIEEAWNSEYFKSIRRDMLNGVQHPNCQKCYKQESLGGWSKRQEINNLKKFDIEKARAQTNADGSVDFAPKHIDVRVGNICNLKCIHCWTGNSSKWYEDKIMLNKYENTKNYGIDNKWISEKGTIWSYIRENVDSIVKLSFLGGEPFASKEHNDLLDWMYDNNKFHIELFYVTNATLLNPKRIDKLKKFKRVTLGIRLDAIQDVAEFIRFPTKWNVFEKNMDYLHSLINRPGGIETTGLIEPYFNWTAYNTNVYHLPETYNYSVKRWPHIRFELGDWVETPQHMSIQNLPDEFKKTVIDKWEPIELHNKIFYMNYMQKKSTWQKYGSTLQNYLNDLDTSRGTQWKKALPEIAELWQ